MARPGAKHSPMQGGFLVVRPDLNVYKEFVGIVEKGDFQQGSGWGDGVGAWYGGMTIQGNIQKKLFVRASILLSFLF